MSQAEPLQPPTDSAGTPLPVQPAGGERPTTGIQELVPFEDETPHDYQRRTRLRWSSVQEIFNHPYRRPASERPTAPVQSTEPVQTEPVQTEPMGAFGQTRDYPTRNVSPQLAQRMKDEGFVIVSQDANTTKFGRPAAPFEDVEQNADETPGMGHILPHFDNLMNLISQADDLNSLTTSLDNSVRNFMWAQANEPNNTAEIDAYRKIIYALRERIIHVRRMGAFTGTAQPNVEQGNLVGMEVGPQVDPREFDADLRALRERQIFAQQQRQAEERARMGPEPTQQAFDFGGPPNMNDFGIQRHSDEESDPNLAIIRILNRLNPPRRIQWSERPEAYHMRRTGDEAIPSLAFQPDEGVATSRSWGENFAPPSEGGTAGREVTNPSTRQMINQDTETAPEEAMREIELHFSSILDEARAIYNEQDPKRIVENFARTQAEYERARGAYYGARDQYGRNPNAPVSPEISYNFNKTDRLRSLAQAKYERTAQRMLNPEISHEPQFSKDWEVGDFEGAKKIEVVQRGKERTWDIHADGRPVLEGFTSREQALEELYNIKKAVNDTKMTKDEEEYINRFKERVKGMTDNQIYNEMSDLSRVTDQDNPRVQRLFSILYDEDHRRMQPPSQKEVAETMDKMKKGLREARTWGETHFIQPDGTRLHHGGKSHREGLDDIGLDLDTVMHMGVVRVAENWQGAEVQGTITPTQANVIARALSEMGQDSLTIEMSQRGRGPSRHITIDRDHSPRDIYERVNAIIRVLKSRSIERSSDEFPTKGPRGQIADFSHPTSYQEAMNLADDAETAGDIETAERIRAEANRDLETDPDTLLEEISREFPTALQKALDLHGETDLGKIAENRNRMLEEYEDVASLAHQSQGMNRQFNTEASKAWRLYALARAKYERAAQRVMKGGIEFSANQQAGQPQNDATLHRLFQAAMAPFKFIGKAVRNPVFFDPGDRLTPDERSLMLDSPSTHAMIQIFDQIVDEILQTSEMSDWEERVQGVGLVLDKTSHGIRIRDPITTKMLIGLNPYIDINRQIPRDAAWDTVMTMLHEVAHVGHEPMTKGLTWTHEDLNDPRLSGLTIAYMKQMDRYTRNPDAGHDADYLNRLGRIISAYGVQRTFAATDRIQRIFTGGKLSGGYSPEITRLLQVYSSSRGRRATTEDALTPTGIKSANTQSGGAGPVPGNTTGSGVGTTSLWKRFKRSTGIGQGVSRPANRKKDEVRFVDEALSLPSALTTTFDLSAPGRQGLSMFLTPQFWKAAAMMFPGGFSEAGFNKIDADLRSKWMFVRPIDPVTGKEGKSFGEQIGMKLFAPASKAGPRAEATASRWIETGGFLGPEKLAGIPNVPRWMWANTAGVPIRMSNRAFITFLNHLNANRTEFLLNRARDMSLEALNTGSVRQGVMPWRTKMTANEARDLNPFHNMVLAKEIADYVNTATGHAPLKTHLLPHKAFELNLESYGRGLGRVLFSPGLMASRIRMLNPSTYIMATPQVRKEYLRSALGAAAAWWAVALLAKMAAPDDVEIGTDILNADFGKIKIGNTRLDPGGGFQQFIVAAARAIQGGYTSSSTGEYHTFGEGFQGPTQGEYGQRFMANKLNPVFKYAYDVAFASEYNPFHVGDRTMQMFIPLFLQDMYSLGKEDPALLPLGFPALFGMGTQTYEKGESIAKFIPKHSDWLLEGGEGLRSLSPIPFDLSGQGR